MILLLYWGLNMVSFVDACNGCEICLGCGKKHTKKLVCDNCGDDENQLYYFDDKELCIDCIEELLDPVDEVGAAE